jgi:phosphate:Na+ symporter
MLRSMPESGATVELWPLVTGLLGGLGLFLLGIQRMTVALRAMTGGRMRRALERLTTNRFSAVAMGAGVTAVVQSSSLTAVLAVGFVAAGLMTTVPALGVVLGANVGSTVTAQVVAFDVRGLALAMVAMGAGVLLVSTRERAIQRAEALLGLGLALFAMRLMGDAVGPLKADDTFVRIMAGLDQPVVGLISGAVVTAVLQSSSATTAVTIVLVSQGLLDLETAVPVVLGANIGTCVTAALAAIGKPPAAVRVAVGHIGFNLVGALAWLGFATQLAWIAQRLPGGADDPARALAHAHTVFNAANAVVALAVLGPAAALLERLVPDDPPSGARRWRRRRPELEPALLASPSLALAAARRQLAEQVEAVVDMSRQVPEAVLTGSHERLDRLVAADDLVDERHQQLVRFLVQVGQQPLTEGETAELVSLLGTTSDLESIGDVIETNLVTAGRRRLERRIVLDPRAESRLRRLHAEVHRALVLSTRSVLESDPVAAERSLAAKAGVHELVGRVSGMAALERHFDEQTLEAYGLERDIAEHLRRIAHLARRIARQHHGGLDHPTSHRFSGAGGLPAPAADDGPLRDPPAPPAR